MQDGLQQGLDRVAQIGARFATATFFGLLHDDQFIYAPAKIGKLALQAFALLAVLPLLIQDLLETPVQPFGFPRQEVETDPLNLVAHGLVLRGRSAPALRRGPAGPIVGRGEQGRYLRAPVPWSFGVGSGGIGRAVVSLGQGRIREIQHVAGRIACPVFSVNPNVHPEGLTLG
ncbi:MAG: hypothetical protein OEU25_08705 [Rhodospirillales bacterium]|nr:hypothetical protein [Rhodospirillales bacterium]MDH3968671.1 hypothetical protein [Rhodospirillales bacterium]